MQILDYIDTLFRRENLLTFWNINTILKSKLKMISEIFSETYVVKVVAIVRIIPLLEIQPKQNLAQQNKIPCDQKVLFWFQMMMECIEISCTHDNQAFFQTKNVGHR